MEFFLEMLFTAVVSLLFSFLVSKLVSVAMVGNSSSGGNDPTSDQAEKSEIGVCLKMDATVLGSQRNFQVVDENVEHVDRFESEVDELEEAAATGSEEFVVRIAEAESAAAVSPENTIAKIIIVPGQDERSDSAEEISGGIGVEREELMVEQSESRAGNEESGDVVASEIRVEERENKMECDSEKESESIEASKEKEELSIEVDDDWEGIEWSELEKTFAAAANYLEESRKGEEMGGETKMELYGLHKIATEGSCREAQPMAVMVAARAKWNAWQKLGNMSQEEAMEQYLALISREIPGWMNTSHIECKMPEMVTSPVLSSNSGSLEDPTTLDTTCVAPSKNEIVSGER